MSVGPPGSTLRQAVRYSSTPLVGLAMVMFLQQGEGTSLSLAVAGIKGQFHVSDFAVGFLPFALAAVGLFGSVPFGVLADRRRRTYLVAGSLVVWTLTMLLCGIATSFVFLFAARLGVGFVEANGPAAISLLGDYYPVEQRASKMGLFQLGSFVGALFAYVVVAVLISHGGWRYAFYTWIPLGVLGTFFMFRQPEPRRGDQEIDFGRGHPHELNLPPGPIVGLEVALEVDADADVARVAQLVALPEPRRVGTLDYATAPLRAVLHEVWQIRSMWYGVLSLTVAQLMLNGVAFWGIYYFEKVHHLGVVEAGLVTAVLSMG
ncbi:MAG: MFS transporter, partial [Mycobacteriales bacterium]